PNPRPPPANPFPTAASALRIPAAPNGLNRNATHGPAGHRNSAASPQTILIGASAEPALSLPKACPERVEGGPALRHAATFFRAIRASPGCSSTPTTALNGL